MRARLDIPNADRSQTVDSTTRDHRIRTKKKMEWKALRVDLRIRMVGSKVWHYRDLTCLKLKTSGRCNRIIVSSVVVRGRNHTRAYKFKFRFACWGSTRDSSCAWTFFGSLVSALSRCGVGPGVHVRFWSFYSAELCDSQSSACWLGTSWVDRETTSVRMPLCWNADSLQGSAWRRDFVMFSNLSFLFCRILLSIQPWFAYFWLNIPLMSDGAQKTLFSNLLVL